MKYTKQITFELSEQIIYTPKGQGVESKITKIILKSPRIKDYTREDYDDIFNPQKFIKFLCSCDLITALDESALHESAFDNIDYRELEAIFKLYFATFFPKEENDKKKELETSN